MPRYMQLLVSIWDDPDWCRLTLSEQHTYLLIASHPKISAVGVLDVPLGRLVRKAADLDVMTLRRNIKALTDSGYIVNDGDAETGELLIRSYIRHAGRIPQGKAAYRIGTDWVGVEAETIRTAILVELRRLRQEHPDAPGWTWIAKANEDLFSAVELAAPNAVRPIR